MDAYIIYCGCIGLRSPPFVLASMSLLYPTSLERETYFTITAKTMITAITNTTPISKTATTATITVLLLAPAKDHTCTQPNLLLVASFGISWFPMNKEFH